MALSLVYSAISAAAALVGPLLVQRGINVSVPNRDYRELVLLSFGMLAAILVSVLFARVRSK